LDIIGDKLGIVIGRRGETLDSLQYLAILSNNRRDEDGKQYKRISVDCNSYREKRRETLETLANRTANKVLKQGRRITLEPMNPYERRIIHSKVAEIGGVYSSSVGEEPFRKVVISANVPKPRDGRDNRETTADVTAATAGTTAATGAITGIIAVMVATGTDLSGRGVLISSRAAFRRRSSGNISAAQLRANRAISRFRRIPWILRRMQMWGRLSCKKEIFTNEKTGCIFCNGGCHGYGTNTRNNSHRFGKLAGSRILRIGNHAI
jgi:hypothetical protein